MNAATIDAIDIREFKKIGGDSGKLVVVEAKHEVPFEMRRLFYIYDVPPGETRGRHAHRACSQMIICLSGRCEVTVDDGVGRKTLTLSNPNQAIHLPPLVWAEQRYLEPGTVALVLTDQYYDEGDYLRNYDEFLAARNRGTPKR